MPGSVLGLLGGAAAAGEREGGAGAGRKDRSQPLRVGGTQPPILSEHRLCTGALGWHPCPPWG